MTLLASVAMLEKLALLKIARCRAPALSNASSACLREVTSPAPLEDANPRSRHVLACFSLLIIHTDQFLRWLPNTSYRILTYRHSPDAQGDGVMVPLLPLPWQ